MFFSTISRCFKGRSLVENAVIDEQKTQFSYKLKMSPFVHTLPLNVGCHWGTKIGGGGGGEEESRFGMKWLFGV